jgi:hypothetical protein
MVAIKLKLNPNSKLKPKSNAPINVSDKVKSIQSDESCFSLLNRADKRLSSIFWGFARPYFHNSVEARLKPKSKSFSQLNQNYYWGFTPAPWTSWQLSRSQSYNYQGRNSEERNDQAEEETVGRKVDLRLSCSRIHFDLDFCERRPEKVLNCWIIFKTQEPAETWTKHVFENLKQHF